MSAPKRSRNASSRISKKSKLPPPKNRDDWRWRLRGLPARVERNNKVFEQSTVENSFFTQLPADIRCLIYDYMTMPPFQGSVVWSGLYLSCREAKLEMDNIASVEVRRQVLRAQELVKSDLVELHIPDALQHSTLPIMSELKFGVMIKDPQEERMRTQTTSASKAINLLTAMRIKRLHIHFDERDMAKFTMRNRYYNNETTAAQIIRRVLIHDDYMVDENTVRPRVKEVIVSWRSRDEGRLPRMDFMLGNMFEFGGRINTRHPHAYKFFTREQNMGARIAVLPRALTEHGIFDIRELEPLYQLRLRAESGRRRAASLDAMEWEYGCS